MFTYASVIGIAAQNNMTPIINRATPLISIFHIVEQVTDRLEKNLSVVDYGEHEGRACTYDNATRHLLRAVHRTQSQAPSIIRLCCYFQSWRYFDQFADRVRQNFRFREPIAAAADAFLASVPKRQNATRVGVHVRRGDMTDGNHALATPNYFRSAMRYFIERYRTVQFIVCSDDMAWSKRTLPALVDSAANVEMKFSTGRSGHVDLAILSRCDHVIISVGSFGWWGAWLANGTTIYYANWPKSGSQIARYVTKYDYFPPRWIAMT